MMTSLEHKNDVCDLSFRVQLFIFFLSHARLAWGEVDPIWYARKDNVIHKQETSLNKRALRPWVAHMRMTDQWSGTICEIMVECIMRNNPVKF